jgi:hypothetical protein
VSRHDALAVIAAHRRAAFKLGRSDCLTFALAVAAAVRGADPFAGRPGYSTMEEGQALLEAHGFATVGDGLASVFPEIPPAFGILGDLGVLKDGAAAGMACVVHDGNGWIARDEPAGLVRVPLESVSRAFKVA